MNVQKKVKSILIDTLLLTAGSFIFAVSVNTFTAPNNIAPGGMTGIATMINYLTQAPIGLMIFLLNVPILLWGFFAVGFRFIAKTVGAIILSSFIIDFTAGILPVYHGDKILTAIYGGVLAGVGLSMFFIRGATTGGTDLAASLLKRHLPHLSLGKLILIIDFVSVLLSALVYRNFESPLYAIIVIFLTSKVIDTILYGVDDGNGRMMFIISPKNKEISQRIMSEIGRGVTALKSVGCYSEQEGFVLLCAVWRQEIYRTYAVIHEIDPDAFIIVGEAGEISGEGFQKLQIAEPAKKKK